MRSFRTHRVAVVPSTSGGGVTSGFYADPYSAYATRLVDPSIASDVAGGTTLTRTWNGSSASYQVYKTLAYAMTDWLTAGGRRLGLLQSATYTLTSITSLPASGSSDTARVIVQGDPAASASTMPLITGQYYIDASQSWATFRKFRFENQTDAVYPGGIVVDGTTGAREGFVAEYLSFKNITQPNGDKNIGAVAFDFMSQAMSAPPTVRYCKFDTIKLTTGSLIYSNQSGVYMDRAYRPHIHNNYFTNCANAIRSKVAPENSYSTSNPGGMHAHHNVIVDCAVSIGLGDAGNYDAGYFGDTFHHNLISSTVPYSGGFSLLNTEKQASGGTVIYNNTVYVNTGVEGAALGVNGFDVSVFRDNALYMSNGYVWVLDNAYSYPSRIQTCDYNAYGGTASSLAFTPHGWSGPFITTLAGWKGAYSGGNWSAALTQDPDAHGFGITSSAFTNLAGGDFTPAAGSPLLNAGSDGKNIGCYDGVNPVGPGW